MYLLYWITHSTKNDMNLNLLCSLPSLSFAMSILPLFICRVACSAGRSWCRRAGSCSSAGDGDWTDWATCPEEEEEEDMLEGVAPKAPGAELRLWEEEEEEEWPQLDAVDWSPDVVSVKTSTTGRLNEHDVQQTDTGTQICIWDLFSL